MSDTLSCGDRNPVRNQQLSPRRQETLDRLLAGLSEKEIAVQLGISRHTVHGYVRDIYLWYDVNSRSELMAIWIRRKADPRDSAPSPPG
jgi:DNA-binding CsgD family transcriptional regulator